MAIPREGKPSAARREVEHGHGLRRLVKRRAGARCGLAAPPRPGRWITHR